MIYFNGFIAVLLFFMGTSAMAVEKVKNKTLSVVDSEYTYINDEFKG